MAQGLLGRQPSISLSPKNDWTNGLMPCVAFIFARICVYEILWPRADVKGLFSCSKHALFSLDVVSTWKKVNLV